jgi:transcriptional repressor NrdR
MNCLFCKNADTEVIETRLVDEGVAIRRRRSCPKCQKRFTTYERAEEFPILVVKKDGKRERFNRDKVRLGLQKACEKTVVTAAQIEEMISQIEHELKQRDTTEADSSVIGSLIAKQLKAVDKIAYIRFASVFKRFVELDDFQKEIKQLS